ncbi:hypothetical protein TYM08_P2034 [Marinicellulosiphila megalodicopiae]
MQTPPIKLISIAKRIHKNQPMIELNQALISRYSGLENDTRGKFGPRQITLLSQESWQQACDAIHQPNISWLTRRANLLVSGKQFSSSDIGNYVRIGKAVLEITQECEPCIQLDFQFKGLQNALNTSYAAGVCCKVINSGKIEINDRVFFEVSQHQECLFDFK